ncbi:MAG: 2,3-dehydroadipyl-CoA hydratase [Alphaproteobacteria bacterium]|nr:2,3-dehydroadipyl-CoA hydratase [Alphaproteobacteria bacterium]
MRRPGVVVIALNRPDKLNALSMALLGEIKTALDQATADEAVRVAILTGGERVFAAGADIAEIGERTPASSIIDATLPCWEAIRRFPKPLIAAVNGVAFGGGCEIALACDFVIAGHTARFALPEIRLGVLPAAGGTQRLARAVGKSLAMKMILTAEPIDAKAALASGLVAEVVPAETTIERALALADKIAAYSPLSAKLCKEAVNQSFELGLESGILFERKCSAALIGTEDRKEGVAAFLEKRRPEFRGK